jgi:hypothetical protein
MPLTLEQMKNVDIRSVDPDTLANYEDIRINMDSPVPERMCDMARQMKNNLYCFISNGIIVKVGHTDTTITVNERIEDYLRTL